MMQKRIEVIEALWKEAALHVQCADSIDLSGLQPGNHMLVDSDQLSFIYILENEHDYIYISLPKPIWPDLKKALDTGAVVRLSAGETAIELTNLQEELHYLLENIKGNANYGDEMEQAVVTSFGI